MKRRRGFGLLGQKKGQAGYTITEVMIVLAITTALFAAVVIGFNGRQARAEFTQSVRDFEARLQTTINEVVNGNFQPNGCSVPAVSGSPILGGAPNTGDCIFIGKALGPYAGSGDTTTTIHTAVGRRQVGAPPNNRDVESLDEADAIMAFPTVFSHGFQLRVTKLWLLPAATQQLHGLLFMIPLGSSSLTSDGKQAMLHVATDTSMSNYIQIPTGSAILICLIGQNGQRAEIQISQAGSQMISSQLDTPNTGACSV